MRWMGIVIWREIVGKEGCKVEEVNEMDGDSDLREIVGKEKRRLMRYGDSDLREVGKEGCSGGGEMGDSDLERDSWKRGL